ncbi:MAG: hypothetical protein K2L95_01925 [Alphaproteobacteria bacterium]|nr:hypothetical protein [Alphaproteobacteria bacterium]MDE6570956.1 hypothetical protein [Alphaproteobacteria bacterium]
MKWKFFIVILGMAPGASVASAPVACMQCNLQYADGTSGPCQQRCNECCDPCYSAAVCGPTILPTGCAAGQYGSGLLCTDCPADTTNGAATVTSDTWNNQTITTCYIPTSTIFSDASGTGEFTAACYYTND